MFYLNNIMDDIIDLSQVDPDSDSGVESVIYTSSNINNYDKIKEENSLFSEILEKCLSLENSDGMLSIINNKLLVSYNKADKTYKTSLEFQRILKKTLILLNNNPRQRCTHIQFLCKMLLSSIVKKKVQLITLDNNVTENRKLSCKRTNEIDRQWQSKRPKMQVDNFIITDDSKVDHSTCNINGTTLDNISKEKNNDQINSNSEEIRNDKFLPPISINEEKNEVQINANDKKNKNDELLPDNIQSNDNDGETRVDDISKENNNDQINSNSKEFKNDKVLPPISIFNEEKNEVQINANNKKTKNDELLPDNIQTNNEETRIHNINKENNNQINSNSEEIRNDKFFAPISTNEEKNKVQINDNNKKTKNDKLLPGNIQTNVNNGETRVDNINKENNNYQINSNSKEIKNDKFLAPISINEEKNKVQINANNKKNKNDKLHPDYIQTNDNNGETKNDNKLLVPMKTIEFSSPEKLKENTIKQIERKIAICKNKIAKLDDEEVCGDSTDSPYIKSEKLKAKVVLLYQELCELTGEDSVKRRQVCIKAMEGHPPGPLKRLETFLNDNTEGDGNPPFPDFRDVVKCVLLANKEDNLGWGKAQVMNEARALFTYCGRALQKRRQKREYEDLLSKVDVCEDDPADRDPELLAKLEANKRIGIKREMAVLQKFTSMQKSSGDQMEEDIYSDSDSNESPNVSTDTDSTKPKDSIDVNMNEEKVVNGDTNEINSVKIKQEPIDNVTDMLNELGDVGNVKTVAYIENPLFIIEILDSSDEES